LIPSGDHHGECVKIVIFANMLDKSVTEVTETLLSNCRQLDGSSLVGFTIQYNTIQCKFV